MSTASNSIIKWSQVAGIGLLCSLAVAGCNRSEKVDQEELDNTEEAVVVNDGAVAPVIACDNPLVQDRLRSALKNTLNQQAQSLSSSYANAVEVSVDPSSVTSKVNGILIDVQNAAVLQEANANGMTTCQASVSMTLSSEDLYQASQLQAANNQPSLQTRLAQANIRINNNMLVDDAFTYVVAAKDGQIQARIAGESTLVTIVSEVMAGSTVKSVIDNQRAQRQQQQAERRSEGAAQRNNNRVERPKPQVVRPLEATRPVQPVRPVKPVTPPKINQDSGQSSTPSKPQTSSPAATPSTSSSTKAPATAPKDDSIDMVIIEDGSAVY